MDGLYETAVRTSRLASETGRVADGAEGEGGFSKEDRRVYHALHCEHIQDTIKSLVEVAKAGSAVHWNVLEAAEGGETEAMVFMWRGTHDVAPELGPTLQRGKVVYTRKPLPVEFLVRGPRKSSRRQTHGLDYFTANGIDTLHQCLALAFLPFSVRAEVKNSEMFVTLSWSRLERGGDEDEGASDDAMFDVEL